jgi:hypothetical protein
MNDSKKNDLLRQIASISDMERGKLSAYTFKERGSASGPYHKLQHWHQGKNHTRYVSTQEWPGVETALAGYAQYCQLTAQYADLIIAQTRASQAGAKKKPFPRKSSWPKKKKSNN